MVELTFDDGPSACTEAILDLLAGGGPTACFFVIGRAVRERPEIVIRAASEGHRIENHTDGHVDLTGLPDRELRREVERCNEAIESLGLPPPSRLRPPMLAVDDRVEAIAAELGLEVVLCDVDPRDWEEPGAERIVRRVGAQLDRLEPRSAPPSTVMLHDGPRAGQTVSALPRIVDLITRRGP